MQLRASVLLSEMLRASVPAARAAPVACRLLRASASAASSHSSSASVPVGLDELRAAMWRTLKSSGHSDDDAATLLDVRA